MFLLNTAAVLQSLLLFHLHSNTICDFVANYTRLLDEVIGSPTYDHRIIPKNDKEPLEVSSYISIKAILDLKERDQVLVLTVYISLYWTDYRLTWDPSEYDDINTIALDAKHVWKPDINILNSASEYFYIIDMIPNSSVLVLHTGTVTWVPMLKLETRCPLDTSFYPFDMQECEIWLNSWIYTMHDIVIVPWINRTKYVTITDNTTHMGTE